MQDITMLLQLLGETLETHGAEITLRYPPKPDSGFWERAGQARHTAETAALADIAACLRADTDDFTCIEDIIRVLERLGFATLPRHDFG